MQAADENNIPFLASALTFEGLLAATPFVLLLFAGLGQLLQLLAGTGPVDSRILFERFFPPHNTAPNLDPFTTVEEILARLTEVGNSLSLVALPAFLWFSTRLFAGIRTSLNGIYDAWVRPKRINPVKRFLLGKLRDLGMVMMVLVLFLANTALTTGYGLLRAASASSGTVGSMIQTFEGWVGEVLGLGFLVALFFLLYRYASLRRVRWQGALLASGFAAVAFEIAKRLFALYLERMGGFGAANAGASIGAVVVFVIWAYYTALVFLLGGVIAETWELRDMQRNQRSAA
ncbi:MAG TPA: YihY/virulence factor BrkB family protein [Gemmatimonadales bacterium]